MGTSIKPKSIAFPTTCSSTRYAASLAPTSLLNLGLLPKAYHGWRETHGFIYENIRSKVMSLDSTLGFCHLFEAFPTRVCDVPMNSRSEYLPRRNPGSTSIRSILKYPEQIEAPAKNAYDPPNVRLPFLEEPYGDVDYLNIVENRVDFVPNIARIQTASQGRRMMVNNEQNCYRTLSKGSIVPGLGWTLDTHAAPHLCDGSYDSFCNIKESESCLLSGHNYDRGGIFFDTVHQWKYHPDIVSHVNQVLQQGPGQLPPLFSGNAGTASSALSSLKYGMDKLVDTVQYSVSMAAQKYSGGFVPPPVLTETVSPQFAFPLACRQVNNYIRPRVALVGDAAHSVIPWPAKA
jgi:hypothetical protein